MAAVILHPHSLSNPSDKYRVAIFREVVDGEAASTPYLSEHNTYAQAETYRDMVNDRTNGAVGMTTSYAIKANKLQAALQERGRRVEQFPAENGGVVVNVWANRQDRYAADEVYVDEDGYTWGPHFEHNLPTDTTAAVAAEKIEATISTSDGTPADGDL
jgi:hypothetical protein